MNDFSIELAAEKIDDPRTREYFNEVLSSFINGNYRSAVVMLWSVVVADLVYKLQSLRDLYQDSIAISILEKVEKMQEENETNSAWELRILEDIKESTKLLDMADYQHLTNLQKFRHLSAHPVLRGADEKLLFSPNKETTRAFIRNALEAVLLKPPILSKMVIDVLIEDIASKKDLFPLREDGSDNELEKYLNAKYFKNLHTSAEEALIKALWKFCFRLSNSDTEENREINARTLRLLCKRNPMKFRELLLKHVEFFSNVSSEAAPLESLVYFLSKYPFLFSALNDTAKVPLVNFTRKDINLFALAVFLTTNFSEHIRELSEQYSSELCRLDPYSWAFLVEQGIENNCVQEVFDIGITIYSNSGTYNLATHHFARFVDAHIAEYDCTRLRKILEGIENNSQTRGRWGADKQHLKIAERVKVIGNIDLEDFPKFKGSLPE